MGFNFKLLKFNTPGDNIFAIRICGLNICNCKIRGDKIYKI